MAYKDPSINITAYFELKRTAVSDRVSEVTIGSLAQPITELVKALRNINAVPPELLKNFNMTYWSPIIENFLEAYAKNLPANMLETLSLMEPLLRDQSFWNDLQTALEATRQYLTWINDKLEELAQKNESIKITDLLPSYQEVSHDFI